MNEEQTTGHLSLAQARETEQMHLSTTIDQMNEYQASMAGRKARIQSYRDAILAEQEGYRSDSREHTKLKRKKQAFRRLVFDLETIDV